MRCPKCGYISFDQQDNCVKCSNDLSALAAELHGTCLNVEAPFFLGSVLGVEEPAAVMGTAVAEADEEAVNLEDLDVGELPAEPELTADLEGDVDLDLAGAPFDEDDSEAGGPVLQSLGLEDIDVSDLMPQQEEEVPELELEPEAPEPDEEPAADSTEIEGPMLSLEPEEEEAPAISLDEEEEGPAGSEDADLGIGGIEMPSLDEDDLLVADDRESGDVLSDMSFGDEDEDSRGDEDTSGGSDSDEIVDLSSLMDFGDDEADDSPASEESSSVADLGLSLEPEEDDDLDLGLSLEEGPDEDSEPAGEAVADGAEESPEFDLLGGLRMESDDEDSTDLDLSLEDDDKEA